MFHIIVSSQVFQDSTGDLQHLTSPVGGRVQGLVSETHLCAYRLEFEGAGSAVNLSHTYAGVKVSGSCCSLKQLEAR